VGRKVLQDIANALPQMVVGRLMHEDLDKFAEMVNARITIDVLGRSARDEESEPVSLRIVDELAAWLAHRMVVENIPLEIVSAVSLRLDVRSDRIATDRKRIVLFDFECKCTLRTADRTYEGSLKEKHRWHQRIGV
jgi:hypothetical protein